MKFPSSKGKVITVHDDQRTARECYVASLKVEPIKPERERRVNMISRSVDLDLDPRLHDEDRARPSGQLKTFRLGNGEKQVSSLGTDLRAEEKIELTSLVQKNSDLFIWSATDMPGIDPDFHCHKLSICREARPVAQRKRKMAVERSHVVEEEVKKLLSAYFIREVTYST